MKQGAWGGDVKRMTAADVLAGAPLPADKMPGEVLSTGLRMASRGMAFAELASTDAVRLQDLEVEDSLERVGRLARRSRGSGCDWPARWRSGACTCRRATASPTGWRCGART
ncbi:hypothetical protein [Ornithinimicrobium flavum]|uniref:hypothetical protein n=1 Tax=Ornithinimicrobium flavum TaxID=1288636 RepID=UPI0010705D60|nr:hypothetical protein [Ornithinimicrobium flavum]